MKVMWIFMLAMKQSSPSTTAVASYTEFGGVHGEGS